LYLRSTKLDKEIRVIFENEHRNHKIKLAAFISNYMVDYNKVIIRRFVFGMVHLFRTKNLIGKKNGFLGKKSFILMLLTWMIDRDLIENAQGP